MSEIENTILARQSLTDKTKANYRNSYKRLRAFLTKDIIDTSEMKLIEAIDTAREPNKEGDLTDLTKSVKMTLLNVAIVIRQVYNKPIIELEAYRKQGAKEQLKANVLKNEGLKTTLPTLTDLNNFMNTAYDSELWRKYIVNYLILTFNTRNMDLDLIITRNAKDITHANNWILLHNNTADYIRYVYKTAKDYDCKTNTITGKKVIEAFNNILQDKEQEYLLINKEGEHIANSGLNKAVSKFTIKTPSYKDGIGQANMLKIILGTKTDIKTFEKVSNNRGTSINNLNEYYNTNFTNEKVNAEQTRRHKACLAKIPIEEQSAIKKIELKKIRDTEKTEAHKKLLLDKKSKKKKLVIIDKDT